MGMYEVLIPYMISQKVNVSNLSPTTNPFITKSDDPENENLLFSFTEVMGRVI